MDYSMKLSTVIAKDIEASKKFYGETLGFKMIREYYNETGGLVLMQSPGGGAVELIDSNAYESGFWSMGLEVDHFEDAIADLKGKGVKFIWEPKELPLGKLAAIEDPNGVRIVILELNEKC